MFVKFWPVLLPLIIYIIWFLLEPSIRKKARRKFKDGPKLQIIIAMVLIFIFIIGKMIYERRDYAVRLVPNKAVDGKLIPSQVQRP